MKYLIFSLPILLVSLISCQKEDIGRYKQVPDDVDTTSWDSGYQDGGTINIGGNNSTTTQNPLVGTTWILNKVKIGSNIINKGDVIHFVSDTKYTLNSEEQEFNYSYTVTEQGVTIVFQPFYPTSAMCCKTTNLNVNFVQNGQINGAFFENIYNGNASFYAWFQKI